MSVENNEFYLPEEIIILYILSRLPVQSLLRFKSVSKRFHSIISNPDFARLHLNKSSSSNNNSHLLINHKSGFLSFDFKSFVGENNWDCSPFSDDGNTPNNNKAGLARIIASNFSDQSDMFVIGSCDGLVAFGVKLRIPYIWNPTTLECRRFSYLDNPCKKRHCVDVVWGFGCVTSGRDYKIVRIHQNRSNNIKTIRVLSSLRDCWTSLEEEMDDGFGARPRLTGLGVPVNHVMYWLYRAYDVDNREIRWWIIGFDLIFEKLKRVPHPNWHQIGGFQRPPLMYVMEKRLCACWKINGNEVIEVGMLKEGTWMKLHQLNHNMVVHSTRYWQEIPNVTNKNRFAIRDGRHRDMLLLLIDHAHESSEDVHTLRIPASTNVVNYTESLISPSVPGVIEPGFHDEFYRAGVPKSTIYRSRWLKLMARGSWTMKDLDAYNKYSSGRWKSHNYEYYKLHFSEKDAITNELLAIIEGLKIAYEKRWTSIEISTQTNAIASLFNNPNSQRPHHSHTHTNIIRECRDWMTKINAMKLDFLSREPHGVDDVIAKDPRLSNMMNPDYTLIWIGDHRYQLNL